MNSNELVELIKGLYNAGVHATVSIDKDNNVEVEIEPPQLELVVTPFTISDGPGSPRPWLSDPSIVSPLDPDFPSGVTVCTDPGKMNGAGDQFPGSD